MLLGLLTWWWILAASIAKNWRRERLRLHRQINREALLLIGIVIVIYYDGFNLQPQVIGEEAPGVVVLVCSCCLGRLVVLFLAFSV